MSTPFTDNSYGDAQLQPTPEDLKKRLIKLREERGGQHHPRGLTKVPTNLEQRSEIFNKTGGRCHICGGAIKSGVKTGWEADHVHPAAAGGDNKIDNFLAAHGLCNTVKSNHLGEEFQWLLKIGLWAKWQMEGKSDLGQQMLTQFYAREKLRVMRQKANRKAVTPLPGGPED
jgi:5-methylcytosine-specific restriction endonuclease McrA